VIASILTRWSWDPSVVAGLLILLAVYWLYTRGPTAGGESNSQPGDWQFAGMLLLVVIALESPLDFLADRYLFSAHMIQHLVLILGVAPLLAASVPPACVASMQRRVPAWLGRLLTHPVIVFAVFTLDVWAWHAPPLYEATLRAEGIHVLEHLSFIATAALFWWIALAPRANPAPLPVLARMGYVFVGGIPNTLLGAIITFAPAVLYPSYQFALEQPGLGRALQAQFAITALGDQELGGLLMWVPGGFVYLLVIVGIFITWFSRQGTAAVQV
jgi:putative membrane protein